MTRLDAPDLHRMSVTDAATIGLPALIREAEGGTDVLVTRRGAPAAYVVAAERVAELGRLESDLRDAALLLVRAATDSGVRTSLDEAIEAFGLDRARLEAELEAELAAERA